MSARWIRLAWGLAALAGASVAHADIGAVRVIRAAPRLRALDDEGGRLPLLVPLPPGVSAEAAGLLGVAPGFGAAHLTPAGLEAFSRAHPELRPRVAPMRRPLVNVSGKWTRVPDYRSRTGLDGTGVVVGIIDTGLDTGHADFRDAEGRSRVAWMLRRGEPYGFHPELEAAYGCTDPEQSPCGVLSAADIDRLIAEDPERLPRDGAGHGTHVTSIAAGNGGAMLGETTYVGMAPGATLIVTAPSAFGGFSDPDILNAARFIFERADELGMPAVINVSLGSDFGPHDGTSALERGLRAMVGDDRPGRVIVVAAGNSGALYTFGELGPFGVHTEAHVSDSAVTRVPMVIPGAKGSVDGAGFVWVSFRPGDDVAVGLEGPGGETWIGLTDPGDDRGYESSDGATSGAVINNVVGASPDLQGDNNGAIVAIDGTWDGEGELAVLLAGRGDAQLWVTGTGGAATGSGSLGLLFSRGLKAGTIAVPASDPGLLAVGCSLNRIRWQPLVGDSLQIGAFGGDEEAVADSTCYFSAAGPTPDGILKPEILAPGGYIGAAMSRHADPRFAEGSIFDQQDACPASSPFCHVLDDRHALTSGTSMSAPHVAGAVALLLQRDRSLTQRRATEVLQAGARYPRGNVPFDYQIGAGALDLAGALQVQDSALIESGAVSVEESYFVLASPYVRPDPSWPVHGILELRHANGSIAHGVTGADLEVVVEGGLLLEPPRLVRGGLWRFALAAPRGTGGGEVRVDLRYRGASLGPRTLPIAVDSWAASGGVRAVGGCHVAGPRSGQGGALRGALAVLAAAGAAARRRRRGGTGTEPGA